GNGVELVPTAGIDHLLPGTVFLPGVILVPEAGTESVVGDIGIEGPHQITGEAVALLFVVGGAVGTHRQGAGWVTGGIVFWTGAAVGPGDGADAARRGAPGNPGRVDKQQGSHGRTAEHGAGVQLRAGLAGAVAGDIDDIGRNPVAATCLVVVVGGDIHVHPLGGGEFGAHIAEQVLPQGGPTPAVLLVDVGNAGPVAGEAIPVGIFPEFLQGDAFVVVFVNVEIGRATCRVRL